MIERVFSRKQKRKPIVLLFFCILAVSNADRTRAYNDCHPDRRKVLDRIGFSFHLEPKKENLSQKSFIFSPIISTTIPQIQINDDDQNDQNDKTQE